MMPPPLANCVRRPCKRRRTPTCRCRRRTIQRVSAWCRGLIGGSGGSGGGVSMGDDPSCDSTIRVCRGAGAAPLWCTPPLPVVCSGSPPQTLRGLLTDPSRGARAGRPNTGAAPRPHASAAARPATARRVGCLHDAPARYPGWPSESAAVTSDTRAGGVCSQWGGQRHADFSPCKQRRVGFKSAISPHGDPPRGAGHLHNQWRIFDPVSPSVSSTAAHTHAELTLAPWKRQ